MGVKVGEGGKLYGSINNQDIAEALGRRGIAVDKHKIDLEQPIKSLGTYKVAIKVYSGHDARGDDRRRAQGLTAGSVPRLPDGSRPMIPCASERLTTPDVPVDATRGDPRRFVMRRMPIRTRFDGGVGAPDELLTAYRRCAVTLAHARGESSRRAVDSGRESRA